MSGLAWSITGFADWAKNSPFFRARLDWNIPLCFDHWGVLSWQINGHSISKDIARALSGFQKFTILRGQRKTSRAAEKRGWFTKLSETWSLVGKNLLNRKIESESFRKEEVEMGNFGEREKIEDMMGFQAGIYSLANLKPIHFNFPCSFRRFPEIRICTSQAIGILVEGTTLGRIPSLQGHVCRKFFVRTSGKLWREKSQGKLAKCASHFRSSVYPKPTSALLYLPQLVETVFVSYYMGDDPQPFMGPEI